VRPVVSRPWRVKTSRTLAVSSPKVTAQRQTPAATDTAMWADAIPGRRGQAARSWSRRSPLASSPGRWSLVDGPLPGGRQETEDKRQDRKAGAWSKGQAPEVRR